MIINQSVRKPEYSIKTHDDNSNQFFFIFLVWGWGGGGRGEGEGTGQGYRARNRVGREFRAIILISDTLCHPYSLIF